MAATTRSDLTVVGMGNILYRDEGVGVYAAHYLRAAYRFRPEIDLVDGAMVGFALTDLFQQDGGLIVLDAMLADDEPGTVYRLPSDQLLDLGPQARPTAHEVDPIQQLKQAVALDIAVDLTLIGIVPGDAHTLQIGLSPQVRAGFPAFVDAVLTELRLRGIATKRVRSVVIDDVISSLVAGVR